MKKFLFGFAPLLAMAAFTLAPPTASAGCRVLIANGAKLLAGCANPPGAVEPQNLRENNDGLATNPQSTNYGTDGLLVNTVGAIRFNAKVSGTAFHNTVPQGYAFFGVKLFTNPEAATGVCREAQGTVPWVDIQHTNNSAVFNSALGSWNFKIRSEQCSTAANKVVIRNAALDFEALVGGEPLIATGTFTGTYSDPSTLAGKCKAGGIEIDEAQTGITTEPAAEAGSITVDNGAAGARALVCFVSANNYLFPSTEPTWALTGGKGIYHN